MATIIHHGGGVGTFKSYSTIHNHVIPQLKEGRTVITNIRGLDSLERIEQALDIELPPEAELIYIDCEKASGRKKIRVWWQWAPRGAFVVIDEAQKIYNKRLKLETLDYPSRTIELEDGTMTTIDGEEAADLDQRPYTFEDAFDEQRHYNWDLILITPNIAKLHTELRGVSQVAYKHKRMDGIVSWKKNKWREFSHDPTDTGKTTARTPKEYKADPRIFTVYRSTKTGEHTNSGAEKSILTDWKVLFGFGLVLACLLYITYNLYSRFSDEDDKEPTSKAVEATQELRPSSSGHNDSYQPHSERTAQNDNARRSNIENTGFDKRKIISIIGVVGYQYIFEIGIGKDAYQLTSDDFQNGGIQVQFINQCYGKLLVSDQEEITVRCPLHKRYIEPPKERQQKNITLSPVNPFHTASNANAGELGGSDGERTTAN